MKKLFLILSISCSAFGMNHENEFLTIANDISDNDPRTIISKQAAPLHRFLTQNLDNQEANPDDKIVDDLAERLNGLSLNPAVLLELKDERPERSYAFRKYITQNSGTRSLRITFQPTNRTVLLNQESDICEAEQGERLCAVQVCNGEEQESTDFMLLRNGDRKYEPGSSTYSLVNLLIACKRPRTLFTLLDKSFYVPRFPNALRLKEDCDKNVDSDNDDDDNSNATHDWKQLSQTMDDATELASATSFLIQAKTTAIHYSLPVALLVTTKKTNRNLIIALAIQYLWDPFVDVTERVLDVDETIAFNLARKPVAHALIGTSKKCQQFIPEPVKEFFKDEAELADLVTRWRAQRDALRATERAAKREARKKAQASTNY